MLDANAFTPVAHCGTYVQRQTLHENAALDECASIHKRARLLDMHMRAATRADVPCRSEVSRASNRRDPRTTQTGADPLDTRKSPPRKEYKGVKQTARRRLFWLINRLKAAPEGSATPLPRT